MQQTFMKYFVVFLKLIAWQLVSSKETCFTCFSEKSSGMRNWEESHNDVKSRRFLSHR